MQMKLFLPIPKSENRCNKEHGCHGDQELVYDKIYQAKLKYF